MENDRLTKSVAELQSENYSLQAELDRLYERHRESEPEAAIVTEASPGPGLSLADDLATEAPERKSVKEDHVTPVKGFRDASKDTLKEFFMLTASSVKVNLAPKLNNFCFRYSPTDLYERALEKKIQFHQFAEWIEQQLMKEYVDQRGQNLDSGVDEEQEEKEWRQEQRRLQQERRANGSPLRSSTAGLRSSVVPSRNGSNSMVPALQSTWLLFCAPWLEPKSFSFLCAFSNGR